MGKIMKSGKQYPGGASYIEGDGINIVDGEISVDEMPAEDMSEVASPMPSVMSRRFKYSTEEQIVGEWIDGKPIYQKTVDCGTGRHENTTISIPHNISNLGIIINFEGITMELSSDKRYNPIPTVNGGNDYIRLQADSTNIIIKYASGWGADSSRTYVTVQYTKTTD